MTRGRKKNKFLYEDGLNEYLSKGYTHLECWFRQFDPNCLFVKDPMKFFKESSEREEKRREEEKEKIKEFYRKEIIDFFRNTGNF